MMKSVCVPQDIKPIEKAAPKKHKHDVIFAKEHLWHMLSISLRFISEFRNLYPEEWYHFYITQKVTSYKSNDGRIISDGYLMMKINLGKGMKDWDKHPESEDVINNAFTYDEKERCFTYDELRTVSTDKSPFPAKEINEILQKHLDTYEKSTPKLPLNASSGVQLLKSLHNKSTPST